MRSLFNFFKPDPHLPEIQDPEKVKNDYNYWRLRIFYSSFAGYALYYLTRRSFTFAMPGLIEDLNFDKSQLGLLGTILYLTYGFSKFASGVISDQSNPRYFMALGLLLTGICNICFGLSSSFFFFALFWGLNGWFQGFGWPPSARYLTHWYSQSERGSWWAAWNISHNLGSFIIPWIAGLSLQYYGWRSAMYFPGILCVLGSFFLLNRLRDTPQSLGLPPIEKYRNDYAGIKVEEEKELSTRELLSGVIRNKYVWMLAIAYFFVYLVRAGMDWSALYLLETKGYSRLGANGCASILELGGLCGCLAAGWLSDRMFKAKRGPINALFSIGILLFTIVFWSIPIGYIWLDSIAMFWMGFFIFGPQMMIGVMAAEVSHKKAAATATGFAGWFAYFGSAIAGYPLGSVIDTYGWTGFFWIMIVCAMAAILLLIPLWNTSRSSVQTLEATEYA